VFGESDPAFSASGLPSSSDPTRHTKFEAAAIYLNIQQLVPEDRTARALSDLFGAPSICPASVTNWN